jgi:hypothetical protein
MDISESQATTLLKAIDGATEERVRDVLRLMCKVSPDAQRIAAEELLVDASKKREAGDTNLEDNSEAETDFPDSGSEGAEDSEVEYLGSTTTTRTEGAPGSSSGAVSAVPEPPRPKRFVPRYAFCENCKEEFDVTENRSDACTYHRRESSYPASLQGALKLTLYSRLRADGRRPVGGQ